MPKQKTHRGLAKRVKRTGGGGLKRFRAFTSHRFHGKTKKQSLAKALNTGWPTLVVLA